MTSTPRSTRRHALLTAVALLLASFGIVGTSLVAPVPPAHAASTYLCTGYVACHQAGYPHFGYRKASSQMWWRMFSGHNCTNYVAYRMVKNGMSEERPWDSTGMAYNWGRANSSITDKTPMVGSVAWWDAHDGVGSSGHVAYVEQVVDSRTIIVSEDSWGGDFHWRRITKDGSGWPTGFVHFNDQAVALTQEPVVTGTARVGETLTAEAGSWRSATAYQLQWLAAGKPVAGATGTTLTVTKALLGKRLSLKVTATAPGYVDGTATSAKTPAVVPGVMTQVTNPALAGTARVDEVLTLDRGAVSPAAGATTVAWYADGAHIDGATTDQLRLAQEHIGRRITATVTYARDGYDALQASTQPTEPVQAGLFEVTEPFALSGKPRVGETLAVTPGTYEPAAGQVSYTWLRGDQVVEGATGPTYAVTEADLGSRLTVRVDLAHPGYQDHSVELSRPRTVTTRPTLEVESLGKPRRAVVQLLVSAVGVEQVTGPATVRIDGRKVTGEVENGRLRLVVKRLDPGRHAVRVRYAGTELVTPARTRDRVRVTRR